MMHRHVYSYGLCSYGLYDYGRDRQACCIDMCMVMASIVMAYMVAMGRHCCIDMCIDMCSYTSVDMCIGMFPETFAATPVQICAKRAYGSFESNQKLADMRKDASLNSFAT